MRLDMSDWVVHFVHRRDPHLDPRMIDSQDGEPSPGYFHIDRKKNKRFENWDWMDDQYVIEPDAYAFSVLRKILRDGHVRAGWSFRGDRPRATIYGPRAACCFTEMPLFALLEYAEGRQEKSRVDVYGIALKKSEFFRAGGRPVIYGLSGMHKEIGDQTWPRILDPECGIGVDEQYRYVAMNFSANRRIDWSHEREWRWADVGDARQVPGLPLWLEDEPTYFSEVAVFLPSKDEANSVLDILKHLHDRGGNDFDVRYNAATLRAVKVFSIDECLSTLGADAAKIIRIDDLPSSSIVKFKVPHPTEETKAAARLALLEARQAADVASTKYAATASKDKDGHIIGPFGFAYVILGSPQSELAQALLELNEATPHSDGYSVSNIRSKTGLIDEAEAAAEAAREILEKHFPALSWFVHSRLD